MMRAGGHGGKGGGRGRAVGVREGSGWKGEEGKSVCGRGEIGERGRDGREKREKVFEGEGR
jgi:hypothetical protein